MFGEYLFCLSLGLFLAFVIDAIFINTKCDYIETIKQEVLVTSKYIESDKYNVVLYYNGVLYEYAEVGEKLKIKIKHWYKKGLLRKFEIK